MFIVVQHAISDSKTFFGKAKDVTDEKKLPAGVKFHSVYPSTDNRQAVCLWEAPSVDAVKKVLEPSTATFSRNTYYAVDNEKAAGLPTEAVRR